MEFTKASLLIPSDEPQELARFYSLLFETSYCQGFTSKDFLIKNDFSLPIQIFKPSKDRASNCNYLRSIAICFQRKACLSPLTVLEDWIQEIIALGAELIEGPRLEPFGAEAWMSDVEGNKILIFVPLLIAEEN